MGEAAKHVLLLCCQLWKSPEVSYEMIVLVLPRVSSRVSGFPVASLCLWGKPQNLSFSKVSKEVVMSFCVAGVALCDIPTCLITCRKCQNWRKSRTKCWFFCIHVSCLESLVFLWRRCVYGGSWKTCPFRMFHAGCRVVLRGRRGTLWHSNLFDNVWKISKLEEVSHEMLVFLHPRVSSRVSGFPVASPCLWGKLRTPHSTLYTPHSAIYTLDSTLDLHFILYTLHFTLHTPHTTLYTLPSTLYILQSAHSTHHTLHFPLHTLHSTLHTLQSTLYTPHSTLYTPHSTLYNLHFTLHTPHFALYTPHSTLYTPHFTLLTLHSSLYTLHSTLYTLYTPHSTLHTPHSLLHTPHSTLYTCHSTLQSGNKGNMYKTVQINYCRKVLCVTAYPCVLTSVPLTYVWAFGFVGCILFYGKFTITGNFQ